MTLYPYAMITYSTMLYSFLSAWVTFSLSCPLSVTEIYRNEPGGAYVIVTNIYIFANNRKKYALIYQFIIPQIALTKLSCTPHMCPPVLQLMIYIWFQNLMFESFCIGFMAIGENVPLSGSHFSSAVDQFPLKNHIYTVGFFCLFYCFLSQPFNDDLNICLKEYILLLNNRKCISLRIAAPFWHN